MAKKRGPDMLAWIADQALRHLKNALTTLTSVPPVEDGVDNEGVVPPDTLQRVEVSLKDVVAMIEDGAKGVTVSPNLRLYRRVYSSHL
jgi:hypothetical protein